MKTVLMITLALIGSNCFASTYRCGTLARNGKPLIGSPEYTVIGSVDSSKIEVIEREVDVPQPFNNDYWLDPSHPQMNGATFEGSGFLVVISPESTTIESTTNLGSAVCTAQGN